MNNKNLKDLELYFKKNNYKYSNKINSLIVVANQFGQTQNEMVKEWADSEGALLSIEDVNNGSDIEIPVGPGQVFKCVKIDDLKNGDSLCAFIFRLNRNSSPPFTSVESLSQNYEGNSSNQKVMSFLKENRSRDTIGGYSLALMQAFGMASGNFSDDMLASENMIKSLRIIPAGTEVIMLKNFTFEGGVTYSEVFDLITDLAAIGASLGAAVFSGGASVPATLALRLSQAARGSAVLNIINNIYAGNGVQAMLGLLALAFNLKSTKTLTVFYNKYILKKSGIVLIKNVPFRFLSILEGVIGIIGAILDTLVEDLDKAVSKYIRETFGVQEVGEEDLARIRMSDNPVHKIITVYYDNGGRQGFARNVSAGLGPVLNNFQNALPK